MRSPTTRWSALFRLAAVLAGLACAACEAVPDLTFTAPDGALEAESVDAGEAGCAGDSMPSSPYVCCGALVCEGPCEGQCDLCASKCSAGEVCCAKNNNIVCMGAGALCH
ncbi:MAG TPA: hypothetical protein VHV30_09240 [Polyangiaceae bacterium]|nr:hypothetical protein [Polyangiaceae bacterium]